MRWKSHVRFGGRAGETDQRRRWHRAPVRSHVGTRCVDATRRRVQNETLGHRGRKGDPLYRCRKLLAMAEERLDEVGTAKLRGLLAAGDPEGHVHEAWTAKECLRELYSLYGDVELAERWIDGLIEDCRHSGAKEVRGMARTLKRWRGQILAWPQHGGIERAN